MPGNYEYLACDKRFDKQNFNV